jgi:archaellum component FlaC
MSWTLFGRPIVLGVLLASLLWPAPVQAQWTVFDPTNYGLQLKNRVEELNRWLETVNQYTRMYENALGQLTNLKGILKTADEFLAQDKRMRMLLSHWGQVIRLSFRVKEQVTNLITGNLRALHNMATRLRNGIFDPAADRRDFEEYLRSGIGRTAQDTEAELERLQRMDNQFERLEYDYQRAAEQAAQLQSYWEAKQTEVEHLKACADCTEKDRDLARLSFELAKLEQQAAQAQTEAQRLNDLKAKRAEAIYQTEMQRRHFGRTIRSLNQAWTGITTATQELREQLEHPDEP